MGTNTLLLILWEICGVTWSIGNPYQWYTFTRNTYMQQPLALLTKNATIFWEHAVFLDCCHGNTAISIFSIFFQKNGKNISFNLGFIDNFFILSSICNYYAYCEPKSGIKCDLLPASKVLKYLIKYVFIHINLVLSQHLLVFFYM